MSVSSAHGLDERSKCRVFIVAEFVDGTQNSTGYYWSKIIRNLSERFDAIYVICPKASYKNIGNIPDSITYIPVKDIVFSKNNLISRLLGQIAQSLHFAKALVGNVQRKDVVFTGTNPALLLIFISILKAVKGFKWMLLVHDVFPENLIAAKIVGRQNPFYKLTKYVFDRVYSSADTLIAIGRDMHALLSRKTMQKNRIEYVPNWVDPDDVVPLPRDKSELNGNHLPDGRIVFQFFGNLGRLQGVKNLLDAISLVKNDKASFVFIGSGSEGALISNFINSHPAREVVLLAGVPFSRNNDVLSACDVAIVSLAGGMNGLGVPSKAYFSLAADKPLLVVTDEGSELCQLVSEEKSAGWFCETGNPAKLASLIDDICREKLAKVEGEPRAILIGKYGHENAIEKYSEFILELIECGNQIGSKKCCAKDMMM